ncbi:hypothetical protein CI238_05589 [Colletotrichum incanum]|uniref:Uncharacterized protein n=1 Tax=Colletotrichum incanum TaxID=1573173 RepID=A0A161VY79_COLIC|nr:hypothetical protein CI238_05589 [Colletotrichum incanum]
MAVASACAHSFKMIKSDSTLIQWTCNLCHSGPHWCIFECRTPERSASNVSCVGAAIAYASDGTHQRGLRSPGGEGRRRGGFALDALKVPLIPCTTEILLSSNDDAVVPPWVRAEPGCMQQRSALAIDIDGSRQDH